MTRGQKREKERERRKKREKRVLSSSRIVEKFRVEGDLAWNYPQTIVKLSLLLTLFSSRPECTTCRKSCAEVRPFSRVCAFAQRNFHFNSSVCFSCCAAPVSATVLCSALLYWVETLNSRFSESQPKNGLKIIVKRYTLKQILLYLI